MAFYPYLELVTVSPLEHWPRSLFMGFFGAYFALLSLQLLRNINSGVTLSFSRRFPLVHLRIFPGKPKLAPKNHTRKLIRSYNGPASTAFLGMLFFTAAQLLIVMMFKRAEYIF